MRFSALDGLTVGVWGAGLETRSFARLLRARLPRARIAVVVLEAPADAPELTDGALVVDAAGAAEALARCDILVRSPGVSIYRPELAGIRTTTPTSLWMAEREGRNVVGITATKGKSTTAKLTAHLIAKTGRRVLLGGNIGRSALDFIDDDALAVIELSSYQIADLAHGPQVAMVSNVYPEHLSWHVTHEAYRNDKLRLLNLPGVRRCVLNALSPEVMAAPRATDDVLLFGEPPGWHVAEDGSVTRGDAIFGPVPVVRPPQRAERLRRADRFGGARRPAPAGRRIGRLHRPPAPAAGRARGRWRDVGRRQHLHRAATPPASLWRASRTGPSC